MAKKEKNTKQKAGNEQQAETAEAVVEQAVPARLFNKYKDEVIPKLREKFAYGNIMEVPKLEKIVLNVGVGEAVQDPKLLEEAVKDLETITGQKASIRLSRKSISNFKLREKMKIGAKVTLRKKMMYEFLDRFVSVTLPRVRDFRGVSDKSFDGKGNYSLGIKEQIVFPEINVDKVSRIFGFDITFVTTAKTDKEAYELLKSFGVPFRKKEIQQN